MAIAVQTLGLSSRSDKAVESRRSEEHAGHWVLLIAFGTELV